MGEWSIQLRWLYEADLSASLTQISFGDYWLISGFISDLQHGYTIYKVYIDDGYSGLNFNRPGFKELLEDVERGVVNMVITKDLSRLGRDYIMTGYYSEIFFQTKGVRYIALADDVDSLKGTNEIATLLFCTW